MNFLDKAYISAKNRFNMFVDELKNDESGVSSVVATVLLILIVVVLAAVLWGFLSGWFEEIFAQIKGSTPDINKENINY